MKNWKLCPLIVLMAFAIMACSNNSGEMVDQKEGTPEKTDTITHQPKPVTATPASETQVKAPPAFTLPKPVVPQNNPTNIKAGTITFTVDAKWIPEKPASDMRAAQFKLLGDIGFMPGELDVFVGIQGSGDANVERWISQVAQPDGSDSKAKAIIEKKTVGEFQVITLDITGTYNGAGMGGSTPQAGTRLLAAAVDGPGGPYHFKAYGPAATIAKWKSTFDALIQSIKKAE